MPDVAAAPVTPVTPVVTPVTPDAVTPVTPPVTAWTEAIPEAYRGDPNITKYTSMEDFAKGHVNLAAMVGKKLDYADPDTRKLMGVPDSPDGYAYEIPAELQKSISPDAAKALSPLFHKVGLTAAQAKDLTPALAAHLAGLQQQWIAQTQTEHAAWKAQDPLHYGEQVALASGALNPDTALGKQLDPNGALRTLLDSVHLTERPAVQQFLARVAAQFEEQPHVDGGPTKGGLSTGSIDQQIDRIQNDKAYLAGNHPNQRQMQQEHERLLKLRYPEAP